MTVGELIKKLQEFGGSNIVIGQAHTGINNYDYGYIKLGKVPGDNKLVCLEVDATSDEVKSNPIFILNQLPEVSKKVSKVSKVSEKKWLYTTQLEDEEGPMLINLAHIQAVTPGPDGETDSCFVLTTSGETVKIKESFEELMKALTN